MNYRTCHRCPLRTVAGVRCELLEAKAKAVKGLGLTSIKWNCAERLALSLAWEAMDEAKGIRRHNQQLFNVILRSSILSALFVGEEEWPVSAQAINPSEGSIAFPRYSDDDEDTGYVVREILRRNE